MAVEGEPAASRGNAAYAEMLARELPLVSQAVRFVASRNGLTEEEREDLQSMVHERLVENDYAVLRKFEGRSTLKTYLVTVVHRLFLDHRASELGRWRPSASSRREGADVVLLERLMQRDGLTFEEAFARLPLPNRGRTELLACSRAFPVRETRRFLPETVLEGRASGHDRPASAMDSLDARVRAEGLGAALDAALSRLSGSDRILLRMRFVEEAAIVDIAPIFGVAARVLYRRLESALGSLQKSLEGSGIDRKIVADTVGRPDVDIRSALLARTARPEPPGSVAHPTMYVSEEAAP